MALAYRELSLGEAARCQTVGNVVWQVRSGWDEILLGPAGLRLEEWLSDGRAKIVKHGLHRTVYRIDLPARSLFLKHYRCPQAFRALRHLVRQSAARREWQTALEIARREIPTARPIAMGEERRGGLVTESYYLTEAIPEALSVDEFVAGRFESLSPMQKARLWRQMIVSMARLAAAVHRAGVRHNDFHSGNVLVRDALASALSGEAPELYLIDLPNVRFSGPLDWRHTRDSLVMLHAGWYYRLSRSDRQRFWKAYLAGRPELQLANVRAAAAEVVERTHDFARRIVEGRDKRALGTNRDFFRLATEHGVAHAVAEVPRDYLKRLLADPMRPVRQYRHWPVKLSHSSVVVEAHLPLGGGSLKVAYKRSRAKTWWKRLLGLFRPSRAMLGWRLGHALIQRGIATARPILVCQPKRGLLPRDSYLATAWIEHAQNLHLYGWALARREPGERERRARHTAESLGRLLGRMHAWNVAHRDLKGCNLVAVEQPNSVDACLIDLDGVRLKRRLSRRERADNLSRLAASVHAHPWVSNTHRLRFLRAYLAVLGKSTGDWKDCWREIAVRSAREIERLQQLGKPVA